MKMLFAFKEFSRKKKEKENKTLKLWRFDRIDLL